MSIASVMPSNHLILCCPLLLLPSIFPSIRVFSSESVLPIRWPKCWSFSFSISPSSEYSGLPSFRMHVWISLPSKGLLPDTYPPLCCTWWSSLLVVYFLPWLGTLLWAHLQQGLFSPLGVNVLQTVDTFLQHCFAFLFCILRLSCFRVLNSSF